MHSVIVKSVSKLEFPFLISFFFFWKYMIANKKDLVHKQHWYNYVQDVFPNYMKFYYSHHMIKLTIVSHLRDSLVLNRILFLNIFFYFLSASLNFSQSKISFNFILFIYFSVHFTAYLEKIEEKTCVLPNQDG